VYGTSTSLEWAVPIVVGETIAFVQLVPSPRARNIPAGKYRDIIAYTRRSDVAERDGGALTAFRRLAELSQLEEDWDTYGGLPPTTTAIEAAKHLLTEAASRITTAPSRTIDPDAVMPFPNGGVQVIWERNADELQVDVGPTGGLGDLWIRRGGGRREAVEAELAPADDILALVDQFLS